MVAIAISLGSSAGAIELSSYYTHYGVPSVPLFPFPDTQDPIPGGFPPEVRVIGGSVDPPAITTNLGRFFSVDRLMYAKETESFPLWHKEYLFWGPRSLACGEVVRLPKPLIAGAQLVAPRKFSPSSPSDDCYWQGSFATWKWAFEDRFQFQAPVRRKASDGSEYDASPMLVTRAGFPWITYYFGYRLGLVASESNWSDTNLGKAAELAEWPSYPRALDNFELAKLPPPVVEGEVVEYVNYEVSPKSVAGHYFYAASPSEQVLLDAVASWKRTGRSFKSGGYVSVCRYYGSVNPGPNTHFYSADDKECSALKSVPQLHDEGQAFRASRPIPAAIATGAATCPTGTIPLYRAYNNPAGKGYDGNHRYATNMNLLIGMQGGTTGWTYEGIVMCVPQ